mmetsp:Transcript_22623/g.47931  ORF Transcript_22623/g.47931 Transcript_22623/m.47931 type:complete len:437 (+) Transcript_22623:166-1476(+)
MSNPASSQVPTVTKKRSAKPSKGNITGENAPVFLRKTFAMITECDPEIATWSEDGTHLVIKDTIKFASEEIPRYFKHNNWSSFVRQLNFYGFKKKKYEPIRLEEESDAESKYWRFWHEKFLEKRPDLLIEIKKSNQIDPAEKQEVDALKGEVRALKSQVTKMMKSMENLAGMVGSLMKKQEEQHQQEPPSKKRRISAPDLKQAIVKQPMPSPVKSHGIDSHHTESSIQPLQVTSLPCASSAIDVDFYGVAKQESPLEPLPTSSTSSILRDNSMSSLPPLEEMGDDLRSFLLNIDDESITSLIDESETQLEVPDSTVSLPPAKSMQDGRVDTKLVEQLRQSLEKFPKNLQELFVERLVNVIASPDSFQIQVQAVSALAHAAAKEAKTRIGDNQVDESCSSCGSGKNVNTERQTVELATAALGSFLAQYGASINATNN